ncbi:sensor histidine kinase [Amycolatopsis sp.]|uniref:sensor histidine kinase n=1 Tax=Amycolatopsis sp. TaxID=37632 RepID=UPI002D03F05C|nr:ATP-binding protein [Amycolatopsis sp.]HVV14747.1 ATP-binding protein [Amycolatopsis sp.]
MADTLSELAADTVLAGRVQTVRIAGEGFSVSAGREDVSGCGVISLPLRVNGRRLGMLKAFYEPGRPPPESTVDFLERRADEAAVAALRHEGELAERALLARRLNDSLLHHILSLRKHARALKLRRGNDAHVQRAAEEMLTLSTATLTELRGLVARLHPPELAGGFAEAVRAHAASVEASTRLRVAVECHGEPPVELHEDAYRIVRDALGDVIRNESATKVTIRLHRNEIEVQDDGAGLRLGARTTGFGLTSARAYAARWDGTVLLTDAGPGCRLQVRFDGF